MMLNYYEAIFSYDFDIVHIPGTLNCLPDALSRLYSPESSNLEEGETSYASYNDRHILKKKTMSRTDRKKEKAKSLLSDSKRTFSHARHVTLYNAAMRHKTKNSEVISNNSLPSRSTTNDVDNHEELTSSPTTVTTTKAPVSSARLYAEYMTPPEILWGN